MSGGKLLILGAVLAAAAWLLQPRDTLPAASGTAAANTPSHDTARRGAAQSVTMGERGAPLQSHEAPVIRGVVRSTGGAPLAGALVCSRPLAIAWSSSSGGCARTTTAGSFEIALAMPCPCAVDAAARGHSPARQLVASGSPAARVDFSLAPASVAALEGVVLDATGGVVAGARVARFNDGDVGLSSPVELTEADADGRFALNAGAGAWLVAAHAEGYGALSRRVLAPVAGLELMLTPASTITGRVVDGSGSQGLDGLGVRALRRDRDELAPALAITDGSGQFRFESLSAGSYLVAVAADAHRSEPQLVELGVGDTRDDIILSLDRATLVEGVVRLSSGEPCRAGYVELDGALSRVGDIREDGQLRIDGVPPGRYSALVLCEGSLPLTEALEVGASPVEVEWQVDSGLTLRGAVVRASGAPYAGARVLIERGASERALAGDREAPAPSGQRQWMATADPTGAFEVTGLVEGNYSVQLLGAILGASPPIDVFVGGNAPNSVLVTAAQGGRIEVSISEPSGDAAASLQAFATHRQTGQIAHTNAADGFVFEGLPLGSYTVSLEPCASAAGSSSAEAGACRDGAIAVLLEHDGQVVHAELAIERGRAIEGHVVDERGVPVPDAWVWAEHDLGAPGATSQAAARVLSDEAGAFALRGLRDGRYVLHARNTVGEAPGVSVQSGSAAAIVQIERFASLSADVRTREGQRAPQFQVEYSHESGSGGALRGTNGQFRLPWLRPGSYRLTVTAAGRRTVQAVLLQPGAALEITLRLTDAAPDEAPAPSAEDHAAPRER